MKRSPPSAVAAVGVLIPLLLGCQTTDSVRALRYKRVYYDSVLEWSHGMGRWVEELYFPEKRVVANLSWRSEGWDEEKKETRYKAVLNTFYGEIGNKFLVGKNETEEPTVEVRVPEELAKKIFALAELTRKMNEEQERVGEAVKKEELLHWDVEAPKSAGE